MHEYSLMQDIIAAILERLKDEAPEERVAEVVLKLGVLDIHSEAAARQAFEILAKGTPLESSRLTLAVNPVMRDCPDCGCTSPYPVSEHTHAHELLPAVECPVCGKLARLTGGQGVESIDLIFTEEGVSP